mmetsp:Transcript_141816/g.264306  ORF Transcript_141816/g.264306 Transcript_141816/m.264306 type:complete len:243 (-) Transcript_141816:628-1356(-)
MRSPALVERSKPAKCAAYMASTALSASLPASARVTWSCSSAAATSLLKTPALLASASTAAASSLPRRAAGDSSAAMSTAFSATSRLQASVRSCKALACSVAPRSKDSYAAAERERPCSRASFSPSSKTAASPRRTASTSKASSTEEDNRGCATCARSLGSAPCDAASCTSCSSSRAGAEDGVQPSGPCHSARIAWKRDMAASRSPVRSAPLRAKRLRLVAETFISSNSRKKSAKGSMAFASK